MGILNANSQQNYMLVFDIREYSTKIEDIVKYFFENVYQKGDQVIVVTPKRFLGFSRNRLSGPKDTLIKNILKNIDQDVSPDAAQYKSILDEMKADILELNRYYWIRKATLNDVLKRYEERQNILLAPKKNIEKRLLKYSQVFRSTRHKGNNHLLMIMQKETRPVPDKDILEKIRTSDKDNGFRALEVFMGEQLKIKEDLIVIEAAFKYAKVRFHLLYLPGKGIKYIEGINYIENSREVYKIYEKIAKSTDGIIMSTANPNDFFKQIAPLVKGTVEVEVLDQTLKEEEKK